MQGMCVQSLVGKLSTGKLILRTATSEPEHARARGPQERSPCSSVQNLSATTKTQRSRKQMHNRYTQDDTRTAPGAYWVFNKHWLLCF